MPFDQPIFFAPNRVWRIYIGGALLDRFVGSAEEKDDYFPEEWLSSVVRALNREHSRGPDEGLSRTIGPDGRRGALLAELIESHGDEILGPAHSARFGPTPALLVKFLDSSVRLPVQCHPDVPAARRLFASDFGKTESWHVLDARAIDGREPYLLMGFKPGITPEAFAAAIDV